MPCAARLGDRAAPFFTPAVSHRLSLKGYPVHGERRDSCEWLLPRSVGQGDRSSLRRGKPRPASVPAVQLCFGFLEMLQVLCILASPLFAVMRHRAVRFQQCLLHLHTPASVFEIVDASIFRGEHLCRFEGRSRSRGQTCRRTPPSGNACGTSKPKRSLAAILDIVHRQMPRKVRQIRALQEAPSTRGGRKR